MTEETFDSEDVANTIRALADDFIAKHEEQSVDAWDVYDWWVRRAREIGSDGRNDPTPSATTPSDQPTCQSTGRLELGGVLLADLVCKRPPHLDGEHLWGKRPGAAAVIGVAP